MASVEWNKKEELVADQALKHLKVRQKMMTVINPHFWCIDSSSEIVSDDWL